MKKSVLKHVLYAAILGAGLSLASCKDSNMSQDSTGEPSDVLSDSISPVDDNSHTTDTTTKAEEDSLIAQPAP
jgi:hypothetical protein